MTGRVEEKPPDPTEGMTEEQKEHEAMKLVTMFDRLSRCVAWQRGPRAGTKEEGPRPALRAAGSGTRVGFRFWQGCVTHV